MLGVERDGGWGEGKDLNPSLISSSLNHIFMSKEVINQPWVLSPKPASALLKGFSPGQSACCRSHHPAMRPWLSETGKAGPDVAWLSQVLGVCGDLAVTAS